jgi:alkanesulfonate monooxygenase SsuD/methylene tetrahydromethanopterin reductase-like flavin-dependent oxidoreductase (luciferase family)
MAGVRLAPVTAHSIATINQLAPGRAFLGIGTGHTAIRVMGKDPVKAGAFREYLRVLRAERQNSGSGATRYHPLDRHVGGLHLVKFSTR